MHPVCAPVCLCAIFENWSNKVILDYAFLFNRFETPCSFRSICQAQAHHEYSSSLLGGTWKVEGAVETSQPRQLCKDSCLVGGFIGTCCFCSLISQKRDYKHNLKSLDSIWLLFMLFCVDLKIDHSGWRILHCPCSLDGIATCFCLLVGFCAIAVVHRKGFWLPENTRKPVIHSYEPLLCGILLAMGLVPMCFSFSSFQTATRSKHGPVYLRGFSFEAHRWCREETVAGPLSRTWAAFKTPVGWYIYIYSYHT